VFLLATLPEQVAFLVSLPPVSFYFGQDFLVLQRVLDDFVCVLDLHLREGELVDLVDFLLEPQQIPETEVVVAEGHGTFEEVGEGSEALGGSGPVGLSLAEPVAVEGVRQAENSFLDLHPSQNAAAGPHAHAKQHVLAGHHAHLADAVGPAAALLLRQGLHSHPQSLLAEAHPVLDGSVDGEHQLLEDVAVGNGEILLEIADEAIILSFTLLARQFMPNYPGNCS
jgi:hypothetical protein